MSCAPFYGNKCLNSFLCDYCLAKERGHVIEILGSETLVAVSMTTFVLFPACCLYLCSCATMRVWVHLIVCICQREREVLVSLCPKWNGQSYIYYSKNLKRANCQCLSSICDYCICFWHCATHSNKTENNPIF